ncbi:SspB family protein [uncultured Enterovirga sp.]|uniref:SspB family protein n=1 Tax=uncultured Enterovirga sp. TaxID=2026352 RepID=UPI0035C9DE9F
MTTDLIRYDLLVQDALRGVVRRVLTDATRDGLPGEHHFYVSFRTDKAGVRISARLRERYPQDMTIVLQHQFDDLIVQDHAFEVGLSFSGVSERLRVPFDALTGFFDPSVQFGLKFEAEEAEAAAEDPASGPHEPLQVPALATIGVRKAGAESDGKPAPKAAKKPRRVPDAASTEEPAGSGEVVSLDAFRKKS